MNPYSVCNRFVRGFCVAAGLTLLQLLDLPGQVGMPLEQPTNFKLAEAETEPVDVDLETDRRNLRQIYDAIQAYKNKHGALPNWLSDLVPDFLPDTNVLMSPIERRTGVSQLWGYGDPKVKSSYIYEFNNSKAGGVRDQAIPLTMKEWKTLQMEEFGPVVPILRSHMREQRLNMSYSGELYESGLYWETDTNTLALIARIGPGPGAKNARLLKVTVLDALSGVPLPGATLLASNRQSELGPLPPRKYTTANGGTCEVNLGGKQPASVSLEVMHPGYSVATASWSEGAEIPEEHTFRLEKSVAIGGVVTDPKGKPLAGVVVSVNGLTRDPVGQVIPMRYDAPITGEDGRWSTQRVPVSFSQLNFALTHPKFMPAEFDQAEGDDSTTGITRQALLSRSATMVMQPGIAIEGMVTDNKSQPVQGARVTFLTTVEEQSFRSESRTDDSGKFRFVATRLGDGAVTIEASGLAPAERTFQVAEGLEAMLFELRPGRLLRGRVTDEKGEPVAGAQIQPMGWGGKTQLAWRGRTDSDGRFEWDGAPAAAVALYCSREGYVGSYSQPSTGDAEVRITLSKPFRLSGSVVDADTGEPVRSFKLRRGYSWLSDREVYRWENDLAHPGDGTYSYTEEEQRGTGMDSRLAVWADGYLPAISPKFEKGGEHTFDFKLKRGQGISGVARLADGKPAAGSALYLATRGSGVHMDKPGQARDEITRCQKVMADEEGRFQFQPELDAQAIYAFHKDGFAELEVAKFDGQVTLAPWASVSGCVKFKKPGPNLSVALNTMHYRYPAGGGFPTLNLFINVQPDESGNFVMDRVPPGPRKLAVQYRFKDGPGVIPQSHGMFVNLSPGEKKHVTIGSTGRTVIGRVQLTGENTDDIDWRQDIHRLVPKIEGAPEPVFRQQGSLTPEERNQAVREYQEKQRAYWTSPEGIARQERMTVYILIFEDDGSFQVEGVPPGVYNLLINPSRPGEDPFARRYGLVTGRPSAGGINKEITIPQSAPGRDEPYDLGTLELKLPPPRGASPGT